VRLYRFTLFHRGGGIRHPYSKNEADVFALVALDIMQVAYLTRDEIVSVTNIRDDKYRGTYSNEIAYNRAMEKYSIVNELSKTMSVKQIMKETGLRRVQIEKYLYNPRHPSLTYSKYFSELSRDKKWFLNLGKQQGITNV
jgi:hypothetical protein